MMMTPPAISYSSVVVKQQVENWAEGLEFDPEEQIHMLLEDKFGPVKVTVVEVHPEASCLMLTIATDLWKEPRDFVLLRSGSLAW
jgi:hypothetical protein